MPELCSQDTLIATARHNGKIEGQTVSGAVNGFAFAGKVRTARKLRRRMMKIVHHLPDTEKTAGEAAAFFVRPQNW